MNEQQTKQARKLEELLKEAISRIVDAWTSGEGDVTIEVRDDNNDLRAKIMGGSTKRIK